MWYQKTAQAVLAEFSTNLEKGLSAAVVGERLRTFGHNALVIGKHESILDIFIRQFKSPLIYILIFAAVLVLLLGQGTDAVVIIAVITINAVIGTVQEGRARNSLAKLRSLVQHQALVRRASEEVLIPVENIVPGDILIVQAGDRVAADARIISCESLTCDESVLTGEAYSVAKINDKISGQKLVVGDQKNMLFSGTSVVSGYGEAVVVATGLDSVLGKISKQLRETANVPLPLARKIFRLTHFIALATLSIGLVIFAVGSVRGFEFAQILGAVIGLSVSIVPEGLPVAVTVILARGVWRMAKKRAIVRQMAAVEAMGNADVLLVDKTGTITTGKMLVTKIVMDGVDFKISGSGYEPRGKINGPNRESNQKLKKVLSLIYLSLKADVVKSGNLWKPTGDPTEAAIAVVCRKIGLSRERLQNLYKLIDAKPFDSKKRYIEADICKGREKWKVFVGAPEFLSHDLKIDHEFFGTYQSLTEAGHRVVGAAIYGPFGRKLFASLLLVTSEEIRQEVRESIAEAKRAGFKIVMLTGDYPKTAQAIAENVGIFKDDDIVIAGSDVEAMSEYELAQKIEKVSVFARITPDHKLKIVNAFKSKGYVCAMTGDGVNDGPALQAANLGIGLGSGTQVAKDASDIVLVDDNFTTIVSAIAEGRNIYLTLKKVILYLFSTSLGEILVIGSAVLLGLPLPLVAVQIIWLNFVTDGFFVLALAQEPPQKGLISRNDLKSDVLFDKSMMLPAVLMGVTMLVATLPLFYVFANIFSIEYARSLGLVILSVIQWFNALNVRSRSESIFKTPLNNKYIYLAFLTVVILQYFAIATPWGNQFLHTESLEASHWILGILAATSIIWVEEVRKFFARRNLRLTKDS